MKRFILPLLLLAGLIFLMVNQEGEGRKVAILTPITHPSLQKIEDGFMEELRSRFDEPVQFTLFNAEGRRALMQGQVETVVAGDYDLIYCVGAQASLTAKNSLSKQQKRIPVVFGAVRSPEEIGLIDRGSDLPITGTVEVTDYPSFIPLILEQLPHAKEILLVYDPQCVGLNKDRMECEKLFDAAGIKLRIVEVFSGRELADKLPAHLSDIDGVLVLKDNSVVPSLPLLAKLCQAHNLPIIASDLDSPATGAQFGYGVEERRYGEMAAELAVSLLNDPDTLPPLVEVIDFKLVKAGEES